MSEFKVTNGFAISTEELHHLPELLHRLDKAEEPSFLAVVALSGVALICLFVGALLLVGIAGQKMLPQIHRTDYESTSTLVMPARTTLPMHRAET